MTLGFALYWVYQTSSEGAILGSIITVNRTEYEILALLGRGKGGYSYLVQRNYRRYVVKQIHHEPCDYYTFGNKIEAEQRDYIRLLNAGIRMPKMLDIDISAERILKEYIEGHTICKLIELDKMDDRYLLQVRQMAEQAYSSDLNIDYFPTNFVVRDGLLYYVDYECNDYMERWNFENWGIKYWSKTPEFLSYLEQL